MHVTSIHFTESEFRLDLGSELCKWTEAKEVDCQVTHPAMQTPSNGAQLIGNSASLYTPSPLVSRRTPKEMDLHARLIQVEYMSTKKH